MQVTLRDSGCGHYDVVDALGIPLHLCVSLNTALIYARRYLDKPEHKEPAHDH